MTVTGGGGYCILDTDVPELSPSSMKILIPAQTPLFTEDSARRVILRLKLLGAAHAHTHPCALGEGHGPRVQLGHR